MVVEKRWRAIDWLMRSLIVCTSETTMVGSRSWIRWINARRAPRIAVARATW
jgi:hypothetical protein